jgi:hypothetical protein
MPHVLVLPALLLVAGSTLARSEVDAPKYGWYADYSAGMAEAKRTGKPIMLVFRCEP